MINGLARIPSGLRFLVTGSRPEPADRIGHVFDGTVWRYAQVRRLRVRGGDYLEHVRFAWWLRSECVDLLHAPHTFVPLLSGIPAVVTVYDLMSELFPEYHERVISRPYRLFKYAIQRRDPTLIAISQTTAGDLERLWHVPASRVRVVYLGVDPAAPAASPAPLLRDVAGTRFILSPFNLEPRKNLGSLIRAVAELRRTRKDLRLVLYGRAAISPARERQFFQEVRELGIESALVLPGLISDEDLAFLFREAALFVFPSLYEGFGLPVLEAMAAGACVVARNQSAMAEVLGDTGVGVETGDDALLAATIGELLDDPAKRAEYGRAAKVRARQFSTEAMARRTLSVYTKTLERG